MTLKSAIRLNCRFCQGGVQTLSKCHSRHCSLNKPGTPIERIKAYCQECATDHRPEDCKGVLIGVQRKILAEVMGVSEQEAICPCLPFKLGKNPNKSREGSAARLSRFRFTPQQAV